MARRLVSVKLMPMNNPTILICAGHDPSGGAGIQADIETVAGLGGHAATVVSVLTVQDTCNVAEAMPVDDSFFGRALDTICADMAPDAIKTGVLATKAQIDHVARVKRAHPETPLVVDPVLVAAGGGRLADDRVAQTLRQRLIPLADIITPNRVEAQRLTDSGADAEACATQLAELGCHVLVTNGDDDDASQETISVLATPVGNVGHYRYQRLAGGPYHGSGCTLASAIATQLGRGDDMSRAIERAEAYVHGCLQRATQPGQGQLVPQRVRAW